MFSLLAAVNVGDSLHATDAETDRAAAAFRRFD